MSHENNDFAIAREHAERLMNEARMAIEKMDFTERLLTAIGEIIRVSTTTVGLSCSSAHPGVGEITFQANVIGYVKNGLSVQDREAINKTLEAFPGIAFVDHGTYLVFIEK